MYQENSDRQRKIFSIKLCTVSAITQSAEQQVIGSESEYVSINTIIFATSQFYIFFYFFNNRSTQSCHFQRRPYSLPFSNLKSDFRNQQTNPKPSTLNPSTITQTKTSTAQKPAIFRIFSGLRPGMAPTFDLVSPDRVAARVAPRQLHSWSFAVGRLVSDGRSRPSLRDFCTGDRRRRVLVV